MLSIAGVREGKVAGNREGRSNEPLEGGMVLVSWLWNAIVVIVVCYVLCYDCRHC